MKGQTSNGPQMSSQNIRQLACLDRPHTHPEGFCRSSTYNFAWFIHCHTQELTWNIGGICFEITIPMQAAVGESNNIKSSEWWSEVEQEKTCSNGDTSIISGNKGHRQRNTLSLLQTYSCARTVPSRLAESTTVGFANSTAVMAAVWLLGRVT